MPDPMKLVSVADGLGSDWAVLELGTRWRVAREQGPRSWQRDRRMLDLRSRSFLVATADIDAFLQWASTQRWDNVRLPDLVEPLVPFLKGYPDLERWPSTLQRFLDERDTPNGWAGLDIGGPKAEAMAATASCANRPDNDFSNRDYGAVPLPAPQLCQALGVSWCNDWAAAERLELSAYEAEHCWAADGQISAFASDGPHFDGPRALYVRRSALCDALAATGLTLVTTIYAEKIYWRGHEPSRDRGELHAVVHHTDLGPRLVSRAYVAQLWQDNERVEKLLT